MKFIQQLDREPKLPKQYSREDLDLFRGEIVHDILNDPPRSWSLMNFLSNSSPEEIEEAIKKKLQK